MRNFLCLVLLLGLGTLAADFMPGEKLTFKVKYGAITAGEATLQIVEETWEDTTRVFRITSEARTNGFFDNIFKVRDEIESIWRERDRVSLRFTKRLSEGSYRQIRVHNYFPELKFSVYSKYDFRKDKFNDKKMDIPEQTQDILTALYNVRQMELEPGNSVFMDVVADGRSYRAEVRVHRREKIDTIFGRKQCVVIEPILEGEAIFKQTGKILVWMTDDKWHIPVLLQSKIVFGSFRGILDDARNTPYEKE